MKKKSILMAAIAVMLVAVLVVGGTLAYFTDTKSATNTFTVGNVKIDLIESTYHREGNDNSGDKDIPDPTHAASGMKYVTDGHKAFTDDEIKANAKTYADYIGTKGVGMVPGRGVAKCPYVINTGANAAYIRIRVMVPSRANNDYVAVKDGGVITNQWCSTSMISGEFKAATGDRTPAIDIGGYTDENGVVYDVYTFVRNEPLAVGAMTEWNVWNFIGIDKTANTADIQKAIDAGAIAKDGTLHVLVQADAIQADGFANAAAAFTAFDAK
jgi:predicted ribosomally synthesized peptide with SipW-like signal peptide